jgi:hypothetical protein
LLPYPNNNSSQLVCNLRNIYILFLDRTVGGKRKRRELRRIDPHHPDLLNRRARADKAACARKMSTGGTRAARAATSRQAKQEIVRLLFGKKFSKTNREGHKILDYSIYTYPDLKKAYLERVQEIHPDKLKQVRDADQAYLKQNRNNFHELQNAWDNYEEIAKAMKAFNNGNIVQSNFTKFGVGCSFSDSEEERALRDEITDQACRGWFSSGALAATSAKEESATAANVPPVSLVDDDMFEYVIENQPDSTKNESKAPKSAGRRLPTLIPGLKLRKT